MRNLCARLARLEARLSPNDCPICPAWWVAVVAYGKPIPTCISCGRQPNQRLYVPTETAEALRAIGYKEEGLRD